jgi:serine/threonine protein phosphatase 1
MEGLDTIRSYSAEAERMLGLALVDAGLSLYTGRIALPYDLFFDAMPSSHLQFLDELQLSFATEDCLCSHAGVAPALALEHQTANTLVWGSSDFPSAYRGATTIVYGHWNDAVLDERQWPQPNIRANTIGVDTIASGVLTAIRLPDRRVFQSAKHAA